MLNNTIMKKRLLFWARYALLLILPCLFQPASAQTEEGGETDWATVLQSVVDSIYDSGIEVKAGEGVGFVPQAEYDEYYNTFARLLDLLDDITATQDQYREGTAELRNAYAKVIAAIIPLPDGAYFIQSTNPDFEKYNATKAFFDNDGMLYWGTLDTENPLYYFYVKKLEDGDYSIQNMSTRDYIYYVTGNAYNSTTNALMLMNATDTVHQIIKPVGDGTFYIYNTKNQIPYHPLNHASGQGNSSYVCQASVWEGSSTWKFVEADTSRLAEFEDLKRRKAEAAALADSLGDVRAAVLQAKSPAGIVTSTDQYSTNCLWQTAYDVNTLLDGNHNTYYHSTTAKSCYTDDLYLQVDLKNTDNKQIIAEYWGRNDGAATGNAWHDSPAKFVVKATNDIDDDDSWTEITTLDKGFPGNIDNAHYVSGTIDLGEGYRYVRFYVKGTTSGYGYWNISEFQLYDPNAAAAANSLYANIPEVKEAADALADAIATADDHIKNLTVDGTEMATINKAYAVLVDAMNIVDKVQEIVDNTKTVSQKLYTYATEGLIKEVNTHNDGTNQLMSNCTWEGIDSSNDNYSYNAAFIEDGYNLLGALIDNDDQTYWHSNPTSFNMSTQAGYLQIDLKRTDVSSFVIRMDRRNDLYQGSNRHGTVPTTAIVYGTNDAALGEDVNSDCTSWDAITTLTNFPQTTEEEKWPWMSEDIVPAQAYRYLRFRPTNLTGNYGYMSISGFQIMESSAKYDTENSQYMYVEGMKAAADKMTTLAASVQAKIDAGTVTLADGEELQAAIDAVEALYQDRSSLTDIVASANTVLETTEVGEDFGNVPDETTINALQALVDAVKEQYSSTAEFNSTKENLQKGIDAIYAAMKFIEVGKWYNILSATSDEDSAPANYYPARETVTGAALYILSSGGSAGKGDEEFNYNKGNQLRWGMDDIKNRDLEGDPDAIWRFIPVEDSLGYGSRAYYIQNLRTGWYMGECNLTSNDYYLAGTDTTLYPYRVDIIGDGQINIVALAGNRPNHAILFGDNARQVRLDDITSEQNNRAALRVEEVDLVNDYFQMGLRFYNNWCGIVSLPYDVKGLDLNDGVHAYKIHSKIDETTIGLVEETEFVAGEPFILVVGDTTKYEEDHAQIEILIETPSVISTKGLTVNGLVANMSAKSITGAGYGFIAKNVLQATDSVGKQTIYSQSGYIDPSKIENLEGEPDAVLKLFGEGMLNGLKPAMAIQNNEAVNVYTIDGAVLRKNVKSANATQGLRKGLYIVGKKKVLVK